MSAAKPKVSVVIPVYDRAEFVSAAVESALGQDYENREVIVVSDGPVKDVLLPLESYGDDIRRVSRPHGGPSAARNTGVREAEGKYICFLDDDDLFEPHKLAGQVEILEAHPAAGFVYSSYRRFGDGRGAELVVPEAAKWPEDRFVDAYFRCTDVVMPTLLLRRDRFLEVGGFSEDLVYNEDVDAWVRMALAHPVKYSPEPSARVREHGGRLSGATPRMVGGLIDVLERLVRDHPALRTRLGGAVEEKLADLMYCLGWAHLEEGDREGAIGCLNEYRESAGRKHSSVYLGALISLVRVLPPRILSRFHSGAIRLRSPAVGAER